MSKKQANFEAVCTIERTLHKLSIEEVYSLLDEHYQMPELAKELSDLVGKIADAIDTEQVRCQADLFSKIA